MGDLPEPAMFAKNSTTKSSSVMTQIYDTLGKKNQVQFRNDSPDMVRGAGYVFSFVFLVFCAVPPRVRKAKEPFHAAALKMPEVQKGSCPERTLQLLLVEGEKIKSSPCEHLCSLQESLWLCIKLICCTGNVCCRKTSERITRFRRGSLPSS